MNLTMQWLTRGSLACMSWAPLGTDQRIRVWSRDHNLALAVMSFVRARTAFSIFLLFNVTSELLVDILEAFHCANERLIEPLRVSAWRPECRQATILFL